MMSEWLIGNYVVREWLSRVSTPAYDSRIEMRYR